MTSSWLFQISRPWHPKLAFISLLLLVETGIVLTVPWIAGQLASGFVSDTNTMAVPILALAGGVIALLIVRSAMRVGIGIMSGTIGMELFAHLRTTVHDHLLHLPTPVHEDHDTGDLLALMMFETHRLSNFITGTLINLLPMAVTAIGAIVLMFRMEPRLAIAVPIFVPVFYIAMRLVGRRLRGVAEQEQQAEAVVMTVATDHLEMMPAIKSFAVEDTAKQQFGSAIRHGLGLTLIEVRMQAILAPAIQLIASIGAVILLIMVGTATQNDTLTTAELFAFLMYAALLTRPIGALSGVYGEMQSVKGAMRRWNALRIVPIERRDGNPVGRGDGYITFDNVSFDYPGRVGTLTDVTLDIPAGQTIAITGKNGAGKSTMISLLQQFRDPDGGTITLDGQPIADLRLHDLRRQIATVPQRPLLFNKTIADNIRFGTPDASLDAVIAAAKLAQADEFIRDLPDGYDTVIGKTGLRLSGGQGQRIALARALIGDPTILVLDEATSMFDLPAEADFVNAVRHALADRTVILITHRAAMLALADRVVELNGGQIIKDQLT